MKPVSDGAEMARGALLNGLAVMVSNLRGIFTFLVARLLGEKVLGTFALAWSVTDLFSKISNFGFDNTSTAKIASHQAMQDIEGVSRIAWLLIRLGLIFSLFSAFLFWNLVQWGGPILGYPQVLLDSMSWMFLAFPGICLYRVCTGLSRGMGQMQHDIYSRGLAESIGTLVFFLLGVWFFKEAWRAPILGVVMGTLAGGLTAFAFAAPLFSKPAKLTPVAGETTALLKFSAPVAMTNLLNTLTMRMDVILLGLCIGKAPGVTLETLGIFSVAVDLSGGMRKLRQAFDPIFMPVAARHLALKNQDAAEACFAQMGRWVLSLQLLFVGLLWFVGEAVLSLWGPAFRQGALWVGILAIAHTANSFVGLGETVLLVQKPFLNFLNSLLTVLVQTAVSLPLIFWLGPTGAAIGMVFAYAMQGVLRAYEMSKFFGWKMPWGAFQRPITAFLIAASLSLFTRFWIDGLIGSIVAGISFLSFYAGVWFILGLDKTDRHTLHEIFQKKVTHKEA